MPLVLFLIYLVECQGGGKPFIHALGLCLLLGRTIHAYGVSQLEEKFAFRVTGMVMTFTALLVSCLFLIFKFVTA